MENQDRSLPIPDYPPDCQASSLAVNYVLDARIVADNAPADGASLNGVYYTLSSPVNLPVANQRLDFSVTGSATLIIPTFYTNNSGALDVALTNTVPETVQLSAYLTADPSANTTSLLTFISNGIPETYELSSRTVVDGAPADNSGRNEVEFYLTYGGVGVSGQLLLTNTPGHAGLAPFTGPDGIYTASYTSPNPGSFNVTGQLVADPAVFTRQTITFTPVVTYPIYLGSNQIIIPAYTYLFGLQVLLAPFDIIAGHVYRIENIPTIAILRNCLGTTNAFDQARQGCYPYPIDYTHLSISGITPVLALHSGLGADLRSSRYCNNYSIPNDFTVQVYDNGPA